MTANQMILLLQFYRGTAHEEQNCGTYMVDMAWLIDHGYIRKVDQKYGCTPLANFYIHNYVLKGPV